MSEALQKWTVFEKYTQRKSYPDFCDEEEEEEEKELRILVVGLCTYGVPSKIVDV